MKLEIVVKTLIDDRFKNSCIGFWLNRGKVPEFERFVIKNLILYRGAFGTCFVSNNGCRNRRFLKIGFVEGIVV